MSHILLLIGAFLISLGVVMLAMPELIEYLKMRRLYVNEPQSSEEDV